MKKIIGLTLLLFITNFGWLGFSIYQTIDMGISMTYQDDSYQKMEQALKQALVVANENMVGQPLAEIQKQLTYDDHFIKEGCLYIHYLCLELDENNRVTRARSTFNN